MYAEATLIIDGAVEETRETGDQAILDHYVSELRRESEDDGWSGELLVIWHEHPIESGECECAQFAQDHRPYATFGVSKEENK